MKTRSLALFLAIVMCLAMAAPAFAAEEGSQRGVLTYTEHIAPQYEEVDTFSEGLAAVKKDGKWGYIDEDGNVAIPFQYELAYEFDEGMAIVSPSSRREIYEEGTEWEYVETLYEMGFIDKQGKYTPFMGWAYDEFDNRTDGTQKLEVSDEEMDSQTSYFFHNGFAAIGYRLFRSDGSQVDIREDGWGYGPIGPVNEGLVPVTTLGGAGLNDCGWADTDGNVVKCFLDDPCPGYEISNVFSFDQGLAPVWTYTFDDENDESEEYLCGFMDRNFQWVIRPQFTDFFCTNINKDSRVFGDTGLAMVEKDGRYGAVDKAGATVIPFQYEELWPVHGGMIVFMQDGRYGYLDAATLKTAIPAQFEEASGFSGGMAVVYDGTKAYLIDRKGQPVEGADSLAPSTYFHQEEDGTKTVYTPDEYVVIEKDGKYGFGHIEYELPLPDREEMDAWAYDEVCAAIEADLVPDYLQNLYKNDIKRIEFCHLVVQALEEVLGEDIEDVVKEKTGQDLAAYQRTYPFKDSSDANVLAASALGIVNGKGNGQFDPYAKITRQEAAAMLQRAAKVLGEDTAGAPSASFADGGEVADWAVEAVNYIFDAGIMNGVGNDRFAPKASYNREMSFMTIYRLFKTVTEQG